MATTHASFVEVVDDVTDEVTDSYCHYKVQLVKFGNISGFQPRMGNMLKVIKRREQKPAVNFVINPTSIVATHRT